MKYLIPIILLFSNAYGCEAEDYMQARRGAPSIVVRLADATTAEAAVIHETVKLFYVNPRGSSTEIDKDKLLCLYTKIIDEIDESVVNLERLATRFYNNDDIESLLYLKLKLNQMLGSR